MKLDKKDLLVYAVTDRYWLNGRQLKDDVEKSILGGATIIQLREKDITHEEFVKLAFEIKDVCKKYNVPFIINDDVDVMLEVDADGIHVGQEDMEASQVRDKIGPNKILGVSTQTVEEALLAEKMGADYLGVGTVFSTSTKLDAIDVSLEELTNICDAVKIPVVAIGGINKSNICKLKNTMIDGVAVVSAIYAQNDIVAATKELKKETEKIVFGNKKYNLYIVDYDGTLLDSMTMWSHVFSDYVKSKGLVPEDDLDNIAKTQTNYESAVYFKTNYLPSMTVEEAVLDMDRFVNESYKNLKLKKGAYELLKYLNECGKVVLFSATSYDLLLSTTKNLGIYGLFSKIYSGSELNLTKVDGSGFTYVMNEENGSLENTLVVEDAPHAVAGAYSQGFDVLTISDLSNNDYKDDIRKYSTYFINIGKE